MMTIFIPKAKVKSVIKLVAEEYGVTPSDILGKSRKKEIVDARHMYAFIMQDSASEAELAEELNLNYPKDVKYFQVKIEEWVARYRDTREHYENILTKIERHED